MANEYINLRLKVDSVVREEAEECGNLARSHEGNAILPVDTVASILLCEVPLLSWNNVFVSHARFHRFHQLRYWENITGFGDMVV